MPNNSERGVERPDGELEYLWWGAYGPSSVAINADHVKDECVLVARYHWDAKTETLTLDTPKMRFNLLSAFARIGPEERERLAQAFARLDDANRRNAASRTPIASQAGKGAGDGPVISWLIVRGWDGDTRSPVVPPLPWTGEASGSVDLLFVDRGSSSGPVGSGSGP